MSTLIAVAAPLHAFLLLLYVSFLFSIAPATTEIYTLSLHDALPICSCPARPPPPPPAGRPPRIPSTDRKSTRLNSSHANISYAVFCLKKKKTYPLSGTSPAALHGGAVGGSYQSTPRRRPTASAPLRS